METVIVTLELQYLVSPGIGSGYTNRVHGRFGSRVGVAYQVDSG
jgi:hypothetical protein